jgi:hypothetical protein
MTLTDTQLILLSAASQRDDLLFARPATMNPRAADAAMVAVVRRGLAEEVATVRDQPHWHVDRSLGPIGYRVSARGLAALGLPLDDDSPAVEPRPEDEHRSTQRHGGNRHPGNRHPGSQPGTKPAVILARVARPEGATIDDLTKATGWMPHSVRAAISGLRKGGLRISRTVDDRGTVYRLDASFRLDALVPTDVEAGR